MATSSGMSECCISGKLHSGTPVGKVEKIGDLNTYVSAPSSGSTGKTIVFITDIFGYEFPNIRLLADNFAKSGFRALIPDLHQGDSLPIDFLQSVEPPLKVREQLSLVEKAKKTATVGTTLPPWLLKHREAVVRPLLETFLAAVRKEGGKVGVMGFCWGGRYAVLMAGTPLVDAAFAAHPSLLSVPADFEAVGKPLALAVGEKDSLVPMDQVEAIRKLMGEREGEGKGKVPFECEVYGGQVHGFTLRGDHSSERDGEAMDRAEGQARAWFGKYLS